MGNWMHEAEKSHNNRILAEYEEYKQRVKDLKVTPLVLPYDVRQEVCKELDKAIDFKPDGWDVYLQMYTERVPLKGVLSKFKVFGLDEKGTPCINPITSICLRASHTRNYRTLGITSSGTHMGYTPGV